jgi:hypothetical protein
MNLNDLYKPALKQEQQPFYSEFLAKLTDNQLDELWDITMESHMRMSPPTIGELKKYSKDVKPVKVVTDAMLEQEQIKNLTDEQIFQTPLGRLSLAQGWADSYRVYCKSRGIPLQGDDMLLEFQKGKHKAEEACKELVEEADPFSNCLITLYKSMRAKNEMWRQQFHYLIEQRHLT